MATTVLVVDDDVGIRQALRRVLEQGRFEVLEAASAEEALRTLGGGAAVDAVVSDVLMPAMSGVAFYDALVAAVPALESRVIFLSGVADEPVIQASIEQRGVPLISKLDDLRIVLDALRLALLRRPGAPA